jgi:hypothetical protein
MDARSRSFLIHVLIGKSILEVLLVGGLATVFFFIAFPPYFQGWGEATPHTISGWAVNTQALADHVEVQLFIDNEFVASGTADQERPDVSEAGRAADPRHGYTFPVPSLTQGEHLAQVYAVHSSGNGTRKTLQLLGDPIRFTVDADGRSRWLRDGPRRSWLATIHERLQPSLRSRRQRKAWGVSPRKPRQMSLSP